MTKRGLVAAAAVCCLCTAPRSPVWAQDAPAPVTAPPKDAPKPIVPLKIQIVLSKYDGERKVASLPFTLPVNANEANFARLNMQTQVATMNATNATKSQPTDAPAAGPITSFSYKAIGTTIMCNATALEDGRFRLQVNVSDNSMLPSKSSELAGALPGVPSFQSFESNNIVLLRDGQTYQYAAATDAVTGQVTKIEVTLTVIK